MGFLDFYGHQFAFMRTGISIRGEGSYFRRAKRLWDGEPDNRLDKKGSLSLEDPGNPGMAYP